MIAGLKFHLKLPLILRLSGTLKNQAQVAGLGYLLNPNFMLFMLYADAYAFSQECYNKTAYSGYQILLDEKSLRGLIHQGIKSDLYSMSKLRHASSILIFLDIQDTYGRGHFADDKQYAFHLNIQLSSAYNSAQGSVTIIEVYLQYTFSSIQATC